MTSLQLLSMTQKVRERQTTSLVLGLRYEQLFPHAAKGCTDALKMMMNFITDIYLSTFIDRQLPRYEPCIPDSYHESLLSEGG